MLSKLLKYELKATARILLPLYAVLLVFAAIYKIIAVISPSQVKAPEIISFIAYIMIVVAVLVVTFVVIIQRFYKNLLSDEGYLMFTLPSKTWKHIACKLLISMMWSAVSVIAAMISVLIVAGDKIFSTISMGYYREAFQQIYTKFGLSASIFTAEILLAIVVSCAGSVLLVYASIALGHLFNKHRILASLGAFILLNTASQIIFTLAAFLLTWFTAEFSITASNLAIHSVIWLSIVFTGLISAGYFAIANYILNRRLNLE